MEIARIEGATRVLGAPPDWNEAENGKVYGLPIKDVIEGGCHYMVSAWKPSKLELEALAAGGSIHLYVQGIAHPVVAMAVFG